MAFPTIPTVAAGRILENRNSVGGTTVQFPSLTDLTKAAGDLLIAIAIHYQGTAGGTEFSSWGAGFTEFFDSGSGTVMSIGCAYKWSTGSETGTFTVATANTTGTHHTACILMAIPGAHASTPPEAGSKADGTTTAAEPASLDPTGWGAEDTLWIAVRGCGETATGGSFTALSTPPPNYGDSFQTGITADLAGGVEGGVSFRQLNAASEDVAAGTCDLSNARNTICVIAVRPAAGAININADPATLALTGIDGLLAGSGAALATADVATLALAGVDPVMAGSGTAQLAPRSRLRIPALKSGATTPDRASFTFGQGIDARIFMAPATWGAVFITQWWAHQGDSSTGSWAGTIHPDKKPRLAPGFTNSDAGLTADAAITFPDGTDGWLQEAIDLDNGAGNRAYSYKTSTDGVNWSSVGTDPLIQTGTATLRDPTVVLELGGALWWGGFIYYFELRDGPGTGGTVVANPDFRTQAPGTTSFVDGAGNTWTLSADAEIDNEATAYLTLTGVDAVFTTGTAGLNIAADPAILSLAGVDAGLSGSAAASISADVAALGLSGVDVAFAGTGSAAAVGDPAVLQLLGIIPSFGGAGAAQVAVDPAILALVGQEVSAGGALIIVADPAILSLAGVDAILSSGATIVVLDPATLSLTGITPGFAATGAAPMLADPAILGLAGVETALAGAGAVLVPLDPAILQLVGVDLVWFAEDPFPLTFAITDHGHTALIRDRGHTVSVQDFGHTATAREQH